MAYGIVNVKKIAKVHDVGGIQIHVNREKQSRTNPDIKTENTANNYALKNTDNFVFAVEKNIAERVKRKLRPDAVRAVGLLFSASGDFFQNCDLKKEKDYFKDCLSWAEKYFGAENIISAVVHKDEKTPHMHVMLTPITKDNRLSARDWLGGPKKLIELQDDFFESVSKKWGLERGDKDKKAKHLNEVEFKLEKKKERLEQNFKGLEKMEQNLMDWRNNIYNQTKKLGELEKAQSEKIFEYTGGNIFKRAFVFSKTLFPSGYNNLITAQVQRKAGAALEQMEKVVAEAKSEKEREYKVNVILNEQNKELKKENENVKSIKQKLDKLSGDLNKKENNLLEKEKELKEKEMDIGRLVERRVDSIKFQLEILGDKYKDLEKENKELKNQISDLTKTNEFYWGRLEWVQRQTGASMDDILGIEKPQEQTRSRGGRR